MMNKRTWHYIMPPVAFDCQCEKCGGRNLQWSEYEHHIWCYDCEKDIDINENIHSSGIFSGPIPTHLTAIFGTSFDRYLINEDKIQRYNIKTNNWDNDWFFYTYNKLAKALLLNKLDDLDDSYGDITYIKGSEYFTLSNTEYYRRMLYGVLEKYKDGI